MPVLRRKLDPGTVVIDTDSAPRLIHFGEDFWEEDLPVGTRVIYPKPPIQGLPNARGAVRQAINHPLGCDPLHAQLRPGMKVTIALDDISLPLPPMRTPDVRQTALEVVLELLADYGIDDVHIIVANSLHRKMTEREMRRMVGPEIHKAYYPSRYYCHDAEEEDGLVSLGKTRHGEQLRINRRACESDLVIYVNINLVPMDGGHKSVTVGLCDYQSLRYHHEPQTIIDSDGYMDPDRSELHRKCVRMGALVDEQLNVFHIETVLNNRMYSDQLDFLGKNEDDFTELDRMKVKATRWTLAKLPRAAKRRFFHNIPGAFDLIACYAGKTDLVHAKTIERSFDQYAVKVKGQCDILVVGVGTGGTITGAGRFLKEMKPGLVVVGADPEGSIYTADDEEEVHQYAVEGVGEDFYPETVDLGVIDRWVKVTDAESFAMTRRLAREEGLLVGGSCGMAAHAAVQVADEDHDALVVVILPDSGRGYISKVFDDEWMRRGGFQT